MTIPQPPDKFCLLLVLYVCKTAYAAIGNPTKSIVRNKAVLLPAKKRAAEVGFAIKMVVATASR
uniref:Uncharacterized protein n=1 Tax=Aegilops tauschii subsp. strangulata TaxID=200361 RepID=A0A452YZX1_AEGTS